MALASRFGVGVSVAALLMCGPPATMTPFGSSSLQAQTVSEARTVLSVRYKNGSSAKLDLAGTTLSPRIFGSVETKARSGAVSIKIKMRSLEPVERFGPYYSTFVLWGITPEGQVTNLGEVPAKTGKEIQVQMPVLQFGLVLTAEPYASVTMPSPKVVAQNGLGRNPDRNLGTSETSYRGVSDALYEPNPNERAALADEAAAKIAMSVRQARRALTIAERAGAPQYANDAFGRARAKLAEVEGLSPKDKRNEKKAGPVAREAVRMAEFARVTAVKAAEDARLVAAAEEARAHAEQAKTEAAAAAGAQAQAVAEAARARSEADRARTATERAQAEAASASSREAAARNAAAAAARDAEAARSERDAAHQRLFDSLNAILETHRETRGLIVNMSDVLFDFGKATLRPEAREKLSRLAGVLLAYPLAYTLQFEGHTDSVGSDQFNMKLSEERAQAVRNYMASAGVPAARIGKAIGYGKSKPIASNDTDTGRASNRRVEIVINDGSSGDSSEGQ